MTRNFYRITVPPYKGKTVSLHTMQTYVVKRGTAPLIYNLGTRWRSVVNLKAPADFPPDKNLGTPSNTCIHTVLSARVPTPHNRSQHIQANTTRGFIQSVLLTMGIMMPETC